MCDDTATEIKLTFSCRLNRKCRQYDYDTDVTFLLDKDSIDQKVCPW